MRTFERNYDWQDARSLWASAVEVCPNSYKVYKNLALSMADRKPGGGDIDSVIAVAERGLAILDSHPLPLLHSPHMFFSELGRYYGIKAEQLNESSASSGASERTIREWYDRSLSAFRRAVEIDQAVNEASRQFDLRRGRRPEEIIDVGSPTIYQDMGILYLSRKEPEQALTAFQYWRRLSPDSYEAAHLCGVAAAQAGQLDDAAVYLLESIILNGEYQKGWEDLNKYYTELKVIPPPILLQNGRFALNLSDPAVRHQLDRACYAVVELLSRTRRIQQAQEYRALCVSQFGCSPSLFDRPVGRQ